LSKSCQKVVKKLSKNVQKVVKVVKKSCQKCQKVVKKLSKIVKKLSKSCQKKTKIANFEVEDETCGRRRTRTKKLGDQLQRSQGEAAA
jgi:uncharacterized FlaG/YvyC family protein